MAYVDFAAAKAAYLSEMEARIINKDFATATETDLILSGVLLQKYDAAKQLDTSVLYTAEELAFAGDLDVLLIGSNLIKFQASIADGDTFDSFISNSAALTNIVNSSAAISAIAANSTTWAAVMASSTAWAAIVASPTAMAAVAASSTACAAICNNVSAYTSYMCSPFIETNFSMNFVNALAPKFTQNSSYWCLQIDSALTASMSFSSRMTSTSTAYDAVNIYSGASAFATTTVLVSANSNTSAFTPSGPYTITNGHNYISINLESANPTTYPATYNNTLHSDLTLWQSPTTYGRIFDYIKFTPR